MGSQLKVWQTGQFWWLKRMSLDLRLGRNLTESYYWCGTLLQVSKQNSIADQEGILVMPVLQGKTKYLEILYIILYYKEGAQKNCLERFREIGNKK
jgi:hypothetical protein